MQKRKAKYEKQKMKNDKQKQKKSSSDNRIITRKNEPKSLSDATSTIANVQQRSKYSYMLVVTVLYKDPPV